MPKPVSGIGWGAAGTEPNNSRKAAGYAVADKWPAGHANWLLYRLTEWIDGYLDVLNAEGFEWDGEHIWTTFRALFNKGIDVGETLVADALSALTERVALYIPDWSVSDRTLLGVVRRVKPDASYMIRAYAVATSTIRGLEITANAGWDGSGWSKDTNNTPALLLRAIADTSGGSLIVARKPQLDNVDWGDTYGDPAPVGWSDLLLKMGANGVTTLGEKVAILSSHATQALDVAGGATVGALVVEGESSFGGNAVLESGAVITSATGTDVTIEPPSGQRVFIDGEIDGTEGLYRSEHICWVNNHAGTSGTDGQFGDHTVAALSQKLYRLVDGKLTGIYVWLTSEPGVSKAVTIAIKKNNSSNLATITVSNGDGVTKFSFPNASYSAGDYINVVMTTQDSSAQAMNAGVLLRLKE